MWVADAVTRFNQRAARVHRPGGDDRGVEVLSDFDDDDASGAGAHWRQLFAVLFLPD
jgi:hypothetical protein